MVVGDIPEPGLGIAASVCGGLAAVKFSDSAVVTFTGPDLGVVVVGAGAGAGAGAAALAGAVAVAVAVAVAFVACGSPAPGAGEEARAGVSPVISLDALHLLSLHRELRRRRLSLWASALVASMTGWQTSAGTRMHLVWGKGAEPALAELGSCFVVDATEAEVGVEVKVEVGAWLLGLATMGPLLSGSDGLLLILAQVRWWPVTTLPKLVCLAVKKSPSGGG